MADPGNDPSFSKQTESSFSGRRLHTQAAVGKQESPEVTVTGETSQCCETTQSEICQMMLTASGNILSLLACTQEMDILHERCVYAEPVLDTQVSPAVSSLILL